MKVSATVGNPRTPARNATRPMGPELRGCLPADHDRHTRRPIRVCGRHLATGKFGEERTLSRQSGLRKGGHLRGYQRGIRTKAMSERGKSHKGKKSEQNAHAAASD